jgi:hypothetical protein
MIDMTTLDPAKVEAAVGKTFGELGIPVTGPLMVLGDRLGLWAALAGAGPVTLAALATRTGLSERCLREWLRGVARGAGWDLVVFTDSLPDMGDPAGALTAAARVLAPGGTVLIIEARAADRFEDDYTNPYARIGYAIPTMACTPSALSQPGRAALGAMVGEARLREVAAAAGLTDVRRVAADAAPLHIVLAARP